jgi:hypothetical protein
MNFQKGGMRFVSGLGDFSREVIVRLIGKLSKIAGLKVSDSIPNLTNLCHLEEIYLSIMRFSFQK